MGDVSGDGSPDIVFADHVAGLAVMRSTGQERSWGFSGFGQVGDGTKVDRPLPSTPLAMSQAFDVAAGGYHNLSVARDGRAWSWGLDHVGQLGDGTTSERTAPAPIPGLTGVTGVGAGAFHSFAIKEDGTAWAWGWNYFGQLGNGSTTDRSTPVQVPSLSGVVAVAAGLYHSMALDDAGQVWTWGFNDWGQLDTDFDGFYDPVPSVAMTDATFIAAGANHSVAVCDATDVYSWGLNHVGQLGDGTTESRSVPTRSYNPDRILGVVAGWYHTVAIAATGTTLAWGGTTSASSATGRRRTRRSRCGSRAWIPPPSPPAWATRWPSRHGATSAQGRRPMKAMSRVCSSASSGTSTRGP